MTRILLDTSGYSALLRGHEEVKAALQRAELICVNPAVLAELRAGFLKGTRRGENERMLRSFLASPRVQVVDISEETAHRYAVIFDALLLAGSPIPTNDVWIAASAMEHGLRLVTTDTHYQKVSQVLVSCFEA